MSYLRLFLSAAFMALFLVGCGSHASFVLHGEARQPLDPSAKVYYIYGPETPLVPENAELVGSLETNMATQCTADEVVAFLPDDAKKMGANLIFVKKIMDKVYVQTYYVGTMMMTRTKNCKVFIVDYYYVPAGEAKNENN